MQLSPPLIGVKTATYREYGQRERILKNSISGYSSWTLQASCGGGSEGE